MDHRVTQSRLVLRFLVAFVKILLGRLLEVECEFSAALDSLPANLQALVDLSEGLLIVVEAVHRASGTFVVHYVEFFVQEGVEGNLPFSHPFI